MRSDGDITFGTLNSISWNDNGWTDKPSRLNLKSSSYEFVEQNQHMNESLNFAQTRFKPNSDGYYVGYTPSFNKSPSEKKINYIKIVFFISTDKIAKTRKIVGFYAYPIISKSLKREFKPNGYEDYEYGNLKSTIENIIYFENPLAVNNEKCQELSLLEKGIKLACQGFNYLSKKNVQNILKLAIKINPKNIPLKAINYNLFNIIPTQADTVSDIKKIEDAMSSQTPKTKSRLSKRIERGSLAQKIKSLTDYKCLVCEQLGLTPFGFKKKNGVFYIETHHVDPVSNLNNNALNIDNLITVCANHHRLIHYGNAQLTLNTADWFEFAIEEKQIIINKIKIQ